MLTSGNNLYAHLRSALGFIDAIVIVLRITVPGRHLFIKVASGQRNVAGHVSLSGAGESRIFGVVGPKDTGSSTTISGEFGASHSNTSQQNGMFDPGQFHSVGFCPISDPVTNKSVKSGETSSNSKNTGCLGQLLFLCFLSFLVSFLFVVVLLFCFKV